MNYLLILPGKVRDKRHLPPVRLFSAAEMIEYHFVKGKIRLKAAGFEKKASRGKPFWIF